MKQSTHIFIHPFTNAERLVRMGDLIKIRWNPSISMLVENCGAHFALMNNVDSLFESIGLFLGVEVSDGIINWFLADAKGNFALEQSSMVDVEIISRHCQGD